jgi:Domain of unknown function (DUF4382)
MPKSMPKSLPFIFVPALFTFLLSGCGSNSNTITCNCPALVAPVSLSMTDDPPAGVSVLFFQVSLTAATLTPATGTPVSLLSDNTPIQIDVTQLQALSAFLNSVNVGPGTYTGLNLTFSNPQLVIFNQSDTSLGSSCAVGTVCQLTPALDNGSSLSFTTAPFPVTTTPNTPLGFLIDFHLNTVIQSDLSVNLSAANGVTISELPAAPTSPQFGFITGTVLGVTPSLNQFLLQTPWGQYSPFTIGTNSSTTFNNFSSACTIPGLSCLAQGQIVQVQISGVASFGNLTASSVTYVQAANTQTVEGTIVAIPPLPLPAGETVIDLILHQNPTASASLPLGGMAQVVVWGPGSGSNTPTTFSIDNNGFIIPSGLTFTGAANLFVGQTVQATVTPGTLSNTGSTPTPGLFGPPFSVSFTASALALQPSQLTGTITATDSGTTSFTLGSGGQFFAPWPMTSPNAVSFNVLTSGQTSYAGFNPDSFSGLATNDFVSVNGWLFPPATTGPPTVVAQSVLMRPSAAF